MQSVHTKGAGVTDWAFAACVQGNQAWSILPASYDPAALHGGWHLPEAGMEWPLCLLYVKRL